MRANSLAFRLFTTAAIWTLFVLPIAGWMIYRLYTEDLLESFDGQLVKLANAINLDAMEAGGTEPVVPTNRFEPLFEITHSGWYWQIKPLDEPGRRLVSNSLATATLESPFEKKFPADATGTRWMNTAGPKAEPIRIVELIDTLGHQPDTPRYSIAVAGPLEWQQAQMADFRNRLSIALALVGIGLMAATWFQVRFGLLPLQQIEQGLSAVRSGQASNLEGELPEEIRPLQTELNALLQSNQDIIDRARTQVGNLAHALKTPLAVITNEANEAPGPFGAKVSEQAAIMRDQVNLYLDRARMAARAGVIGRVSEVGGVIEPLARALERINRDKGIAISIDCPPAAKFLGEKQDLEEMLGNLMDNACKWARRTVRVGIVTLPETRTARRQIEITIEDDGPGLKPEQRAQLGKRGVRLDESKPGSGLGLSIVTDLAASYRGKLELAASAHGGLKAKLTLPGA